MHYDKTAIAVFLYHQHVSTGHTQHVVPADDSGTSSVSSAYKVDTNQDGKAAGTGENNLLGEPYCTPLHTSDS